MAQDQRRDFGIARWCATASPVATFGEGLFDRLSSAIGHEGAFLATVDPATLLYTGAFGRGLPVEAGPAFIQTELGDDDVNQLRHLARAASPVGWLDQTTQGERQNSVRYRLAMAPHGMGDELRTALMVDGECWGLLCLHRADVIAGFDARDAATLARIAPTIALAIRRSVIAEQAHQVPVADGPGVAVLNPDLTVQSCTAAASRWLAELAELDHPRSPLLPSPVHGVVQRLRAGPGRSDETAARARVRTPSGAWVTVHASELDATSGTVAVVFEPTSQAALAPMIISAYGLTSREGEVTQRLLAGLARKEIAAELRISLHTVNDHVKAVFDKTGASSAGQLRMRILGKLQTPR